MSNYYSINPRFYISVDCIIFGFNEGELNLLLLKRNFQPAMGEWSLMGGFVQRRKMLDNHIRKSWFKRDAEPNIPENTAFRPMPENDILKASFELESETLWFADK